MKSAQLGQISRKRHNVMKSAPNHHSTPRTRKYTMKMLKTTTKNIKHTNIYKKYRFYVFRCFADTEVARTTEDLLGDGSEDLPRTFLGILASKSQHKHKKYIESYKIIPTPCFFYLFDSCVSFLIKTTKWGDFITLFLFEY